MKALIVDCLARGGDGRKATLDVLGVGPRAVAGVLEREGIRYRLLSFEEYCSRAGRIGDYDLLLVSGMTVDKSAVMKTLKLWRNFNNGISILGGPISTGILHDYTLYSYDVIVWGECEKSLPKLLKCLRKRDGVRIEYEKLCEIKGLAYRFGDEKVFTGYPQLTTREELDKLTPSIKAVTHYRDYWALRVYVEVVRGCSNFLRPKLRLPNGKKCIDCGICYSGDFKRRIECPLNIPPGCGYCSIPRVYGPSRSRSVDSIYEEVKNLIRLGVTRIVLSASDFLDYGRDWLVEPEPLTDPVNPSVNLDAISSLLEKLTSIDEVGSGEASILIENIKASLVSEEIAKVLGEYLRGTPVHIGCETGCEEHAVLIGRPTTPNQVLEACKMLRKYGLRPYVYFIHGLPGQNWHTTRETIKAIRELSKIGVEKITVYRFKPLPETAFEKFPQGKPAYQDIKSRLIVEAVEKANLRSKEAFKGRVLRCVVVRSKKSREDGIGYPLLHGPVVRIRHGRKYVGFLVDTKITSVEKERVVEGEVVGVVKNLRDIRV